MRRAPSRPGIVLMSSLLLALVAARPATSDTCTSSLFFGTAVHPTSGPNPLFIQSADFNEDGIPDLAVTNSNFQGSGAGPSLGILLGLGAGAFATAVTYPTGSSPHGLAVADFNSDGILDVAVANLSSNTISVFPGQGSGGVGDGTFGTSLQFECGDNPFELVAADFDGDGIMDLAAALNQIPGIAVLKGLGSGSQGNGTFGAPLVLPLASIVTDLLHADLNGDGFEDVVAGENGTGTVGVILGTGVPGLGTTSFATATHYNAGGAPVDVASADFNGDGKIDLVVAGGTGTWVLSGAGDGTFSAPVGFPTGNSTGVEPADFNGDGILDLAICYVTGTNLGAVELLVGQGTGGVGNGLFGGMQTYATGADPYRPISGFFTGGAFRDLIVTNYLTNQLTVLPGACNAALPDPRLPKITKVKDVPNDQGGRVFLTWLASSADIFGGAVNSYRVWRRIPPGLDAAALASGLKDCSIIEAPSPSANRATELVYWEALETLPAQRLQGYGYTAATTQDSLPLSNPYTAFFITALTSNIDVFYSSPVDSGYSVDNRAPHPPFSLTGDATVSGFALHWLPNTEPDFAEYRIYRGPTADFEPAFRNLLAAVPDTGWVDPAGSEGEYYKVGSVDIHGNTSDYALLGVPITTGVGDGPPAAFGLRGIAPNPSFDGQLSIAFTLLPNVPARLELLDLAGRRVASRAVAGAGSGEHVERFGTLERLPAGVYLVRLTQAGQHRELKAVVIN